MAGRLSEMNLPRFPLLTNEEAQALLLQAKTGDEAARERLINCNLRLVFNLIQRFAGRGYEMEDLFQIGTIGLMKAIDKFDTTYNVRFSTYAVPMIIGEIRRYLRDNNSIRVSRSLRDIAYKAFMAKEQLANRLQREPTVSEIADEIQVKREDVVMALDSVQEPVSLFEPVFHDNGDAVYVMDQVSDKKNKEENWVKDLSLQDALDTLNERDKKIIKMRFFEGKTQIEVADEIHISQAQVSRLEKNALKSMKHYLRV